jgi:hypothetical protein
MLDWFSSLLRYLSSRHSPVPKKTFGQLEPALLSLSSRSGKRPLILLIFGSLVSVAGLVLYYCGFRSSSKFFFFLKEKFGEMKTTRTFALPIKRQTVRKKAFQFFLRFEAVEKGAGVRSYLQRG